MTILKVFSETGSIPGRHPSAEVFKHCPPPTRLRTPKIVIRPASDGQKSEVGKPDPLWG